MFSSSALVYSGTGMEVEEPVNGSTIGSLRHHWGKVPLLVCMKLVGSGLGYLQRTENVSSDHSVTNTELYPSLNINVFVKICPNALLLASDFLCLLLSLERYKGLG